MADAGCEELIVITIGEFARSCLNTERWARCVCPRECFEIHQIFGNHQVISDHTPQTERSEDEENGGDKDRPRSTETLL